VAVGPCSEPGQLEVEAPASSALHRPLGALAKARALAPLEHQLQALVVAVAYSAHRRRLPAEVRLARHRRLVAVQASLAPRRQRPQGVSSEQAPRQEEMFLVLELRPLGEVEACSVLQQQHHLVEQQVCLVLLQHRPHRRRLLAACSAQVLLEGAACSAHPQPRRALHHHLQVSSVQVPRAPLPQEVVGFSAQLQDQHLMLPVVCLVHLRLLQLPLLEVCLEHQGLLAEAPLLVRGVACLERLRPRVQEVEGCLVLLVVLPLPEAASLAPHQRHRVPHLLQLHPLLVACSAEQPVCLVLQFQALVEVLQPRPQPAASLGHLAKHQVGAAAQAVSLVLLQQVVGTQPVGFLVPQAGQLPQQQEDYSVPHLPLLDPQLPEASLVVPLQQVQCRPQAASSVRHHQEPPQGTCLGQQPLPVELLKQGAYLAHHLQAARCLEHHLPVQLPQAAPSSVQRPPVQQLQVALYSAVHPPGQHPLAAQSSVQRPPVQILQEARYLALHRLPQHHRAARCSVLQRPVQLPRAGPSSVRRLPLQPPQAGRSSGLHPLAQPPQAGRYLVLGPLEQHLQVARYLALHHQVEATSLVLLPVGPHLAASLGLAAPHPQEPPSLEQPPREVPLAVLRPGCNKPRPRLWSTERSPTCCTRGRSGSTSKPSISRHLQRRSCRWTRKSLLTPARLKT